MIQLAFLFISSILMVQSCTHHTLQNDPFADVPIVIDDDSIKLNPLKLGHLQYIPLETSKECLIGRADKVLVRNNKIYVADFDKAMALFVFDMNGKYLFKIARTGNGPGEYVSFDDFDLQVNGDIYMFDGYGKKFQVFNSAGEYLRDIKTDYYLSNFCLADDNMYWSIPLDSTRKMLANLAVYNMNNNKTEFQLTDKQYLYDASLMFDFSFYDFYYSPSNTYYAPKFSEIIYSINNKGIFPAIGVKNLLKLPSDALDELIQERDPDKHLKLTFKNSDKYFMQNLYVYETDKYVAFKCIGGKIDYSVVLYNKHSKSACAIAQFEFFDHTGVDEFDGVRGSTGNYFFNTIAFDPDNEHHRKILQSRKELANWKEDDNPVVVFWDFDM